MTEEAQPKDETAPIEEDAATAPSDEEEDLDHGEDMVTPELTEGG